MHRQHAICLSHRRFEFCTVVGWQEKNKMSPNDIETLLANLDEQQRLRVFQILRERYGFKIHSLETRWNTSAEAILEAIDKSADLTQRGIRGILAEASFRTVVLPRNLSHWRETPIEGTPAYDLQLDDGRGTVRVQVKLQRKEKGNPKFFRGSADHFVVETQRTRGGKRKDNEQSGSYRINEFDVLTVCLHPSTNESGHRSSTAQRST